jgi:formate hydrogenlyase subunit 4
MKELLSLLCSTPMEQIMTQTLQQLGQAVGLGIINIFLLVVMAPLIDGILRKVRARLHSRQGPPLVQPYFDLLKLLGKERLTPNNASVGFGGLVWRVTPALCLGAVITASLFVPIGGVSPLGFSGDIIAFLYLFGLATVAIVLGGFASGNPYAYVGASREIMMMLTAEPVMAIALVALAVRARTMSFEGILAQQWLGPTVSGVVAAIAFLMAISALIGKLPFDVAEAETEIMEGAYIERSGPDLALFKLAGQAKTVIFAVLLVELFLPWPRTNMVVTGLLDVVKVLVVLALIEVGNVANPRLRVEQAMVYFSRVIVFVSVIALGFAIVGK